MRTLAIVFSLLALATAVASADTFRAKPNLSIPDNVPAGVTDTLSASPSCTINDVDIVLEVDHTWVGDLVVTITHAGTTVTLVDRPGRAPGGTNVGCSADMGCVRQVVLDDETGGSPPPAIECASPLPCTTCFPGGQVPAQSFIPNEVLSVFDTSDQAGDWIISIADNEALDTGTICAWEVRTSCGPSAVEPATWGKIKARYQQ
jgi:hypothetical protein